MSSRSSSSSVPKVPQSAPTANPHAAPGPAPAARAALLRIAHVSLSASLRHDYFSNGKGHQQSKALISVKQVKPAKAARLRPAPADTPSDAPNAAPGEPLDEADLLHTRLDDAAPAQESAPAQSPAFIDERASAVGPDIAARYLADVATCRRLNSSEEYHLANLASEGDLGSRQRLIEHHLGLVVMMARRYVNRGLPLLDLIEEGNLGLITASAKFDPELGYRFSTYAKWWIRQAIELALMTQSRLVRLPIHLSRSAKQAARLHKQAQRAVANGAEGAEGAEGSAVVSDPGAGLSADLVALLDDDDRDGGQGVDELPAAEDSSPEAHLSDRERRAQLMRVLDELSDKERRVVEGRYGLRQLEPRTLDDIARELQLSCERVRQIEKEALYKLRGLFANHGIAVDTLF